MHIPIGAAAGRLWTLTIRQAAGVDGLVLAISGRLGVRASEQLADLLAQATRDGYRRILCDLERVDYISSRGLLALDEASIRIKHAGGELLICALQDPARLALELSGIEAHFAVAPSRDAALALFERREGS